MASSFRNLSFALRRFVPPLALVATMSLVSACASTGGYQASAPPTGGYETSIANGDRKQAGARPSDPAEETSTTTQPLLNADYWKGYVLRPVDFLTGPARWGSDEWLAAGLVGGAAAGLYFVEEDMRAWIQDNKSATATRISAVAEPFGNKNYLLPAIGAGYAAGFLAGDRKAQETALLALQSFAISAGFTKGLKYALRRARPRTERGHAAFDRPSLTDGDKSFASGHAANAFGVATVIASQYDDPWIQAAAYATALGTAWSRVYDDKHWVTDVVAGAAIGYGVGKVVTQFSPFRENHDVVVLPMFAEDTYGVAMQLKY